MSEKVKKADLAKKILESEEFDKMLDEKLEKKLGGKPKPESKDDDVIDWEH